MPCSLLFACEDPPTKLSRVYLCGVYGGGFLQGHAHAQGLQTNAGAYSNQIDHRGPAVLRGSSHSVWSCLLVAKCKPGNEIFAV